MAKGVVETDLEVCKVLAKIAINSQKLAAKRVSSDIFLEILASICLCLAVQEPKAIKGVLNLVLFVNRFAGMVADVSTPEIGLLSKSNTRLASKWAAFRYSAIYF